MNNSRATANGMRRKPRQARSQERVDRILDVAEELFVSQGYNITTTNAIAARAQVPIGSLYQFFPDKAAILQALATRYGELLHQQLTTREPAELAKLPLGDYVDWLIDTTARFFAAQPGYHAIFMEVQGSIPELQEIEDAADTQLIQAIAASIARRQADLDEADYQAIAFILVKAIGTLLWLSLSQESTFQQRLVLETKRFAFNYLKSYCPIEIESAKGYL